MSKEELKCDWFTKQKNKKPSSSSGETHAFIEQSYNGSSLEEKLELKKQIFKLEQELKAEKELNAEIKVRFVKCNTCTPEMKEKCLMFNENLCEGERCEELVDLMSLINKRDTDDKVKELEQENAELKEQHEVSARNMSSFIESLSKSENEAKKQLTRAKGIIKDYILVAKVEHLKDRYESVDDAEQFLKEIDK